MNGLQYAFATLLALVCVVVAIAGLVTAIIGRTGDWGWFA